MHWKAVAFIRAFTLSRMLEIKTGVNSLSLLCLWKMVVLVGILMLNRLPLIGGEPGVQITKLIIISDPFHPYVRGIEVESGKEDQIAIDDSGLDV